MAPPAGPSALDRPVGSERPAVDAGVVSTGQAAGPRRQDHLSAAQTQLASVYLEYKQLILALGADLIFSHDLGGQFEHAGLLHARCVAAEEGADNAGVRVALAATASAVAELQEALTALMGTEGTTGLALARVRQRHRALRRQIWEVLPVEYLPCSPEHTHGNGPPVDSDAVVDSGFEQGAAHGHRH